MLALMAIEQTMRCDGCSRTIEPTPIAELDQFAEKRLEQHRERGSLFYFVQAQRKGWGETYVGKTTENFDHVLAGVSSPAISWHLCAACFNTRSLGSLVLAVPAR